MRGSLWILMMLVLAGGCAAPEVEQVSDASPVEAVELDDAAWTAALIEHRQEIDEEFRTSKESPMAGTQYLKSEPGDEVYLAFQDGVFELADAAGPLAQIAATKKQGTWHWQKLGQDVACTVDGEEVADGSALEGPAGFDIGTFHLSFYPSEDRVTYIVFDPERPEMTSFEHLLYFPPDRYFAVDAKLVVHPEPETIEMPTTRNLIKTFYRYAAIEFELDGDKQQLTALKSELTGEGSKGLFIAFRDATTGRETYGAGRYLEPEETHDSRVLLDFNYAYNPYCAYNERWSCPLPPAENRLPVPIRAGERSFPG